MVVVATAGGLEQPFLATLFEPIFQRSDENRFFGPPALST
jgi:hypothetical protein